MDDKICKKIRNYDLSFITDKNKKYVKEVIDLLEDNEERIRHKNLYYFLYSYFYPQTLEKKYKTLLEMCKYYTYNLISKKQRMNLFYTAYNESLDIVGLKKKYTKNELYQITGVVQMVYVPNPEVNSIGSNILYRDIKQASSSGEFMGHKYHNTLQYIILNILYNLALKLSSNYKLINNNCFTQLAFVNLTGFDLPMISPDEILKKLDLKKLIQEYSEVGPDELGVYSPYRKSIVPLILEKKPELINSADEKELFSVLSQDESINEKFVSKYMDKPWDISKLSSNSAIRPEFILEHLNDFVDEIEKEYLWEFFVDNEKITTKFIKDNIKTIIELGEDFEWERLGENKALGMDFMLIDELVDPNFYYNEKKNFLGNPNIPMEYIEGNDEMMEDEEYVWSKLPENPNITDSFILKHEDELDFGILSSNPSLNPDLVSKKIEADWSWGWGGLSENPAITPTVIKNLSSQNWEWEAISKNPSITPDFVVENNDKDWDWQALSANEGLTIEFLFDNWKKVDPVFFSMNPRVVDLFNNYTRYITLKDSMINPKNPLHNLPQELVEKIIRE